MIHRLGDRNWTSNSISTRFGIRVVKYLMCGRDSTYTYPDVIKMMQEGDGNEHSKKEQAVRHRWGEYQICFDLLYLIH